MIKWEAATLGAGLRHRREEQKWTVKDIEANSQKSSKAPFKANLAYKWERGDLFPAFDRVINDILPAYGIADLVEFLLRYCAEPEFDHIKVIKKGTLNIDNALGITIAYAKPEYVHPQLVRIDRITVKNESKPTGHAGYNYLLVIDGQLECTFSNGNQKKQRYVLSSGDAIAFPTKLIHTVKPLKGTVDAVVARPLWGIPKPVISE